MKIRGKYTILWEQTRREWIRKNPPSHEGYYTCWLCNRHVHKDEFELDHIIARSRRPDLRFVLSNLAPSHHTCNSRRGSKEIVKPSKTYPQVHEDIWDGF